jgi:hypothetical protein
MAKKRLSKKKAKPFNVLQTPYRTQGDFNTAVNRTARGSIQPALNELQRNRTQETMSHTGRTGDITSMYNAGSDARKAALDRTSTALNSLITLNSGLSGATRDAVAAALRSGQDREQAVAAQLGVAAQPNQGQQYMDAAQAQSDLQGIGLTGQFSEILGGLGRDIGGNEVGRQEASRHEQSRWDDVLAQLKGERRNIMSGLPQAKEQARQNLMTTELQRNAQGVQQGLAERQFGLSKKQFGEQVRQDKFQRGLANRQQVETERQGRSGRGLAKSQEREAERHNLVQEAIDIEGVSNTKETLRQQAQQAGDANTKVELQAKAKRFDNGVKILSDYFTQEQGKNKTRRTYEQRVTHGYSEMVSQLKAATGAGDIEARQMILAAVNASTPWGARWVRRAQQEIRTIKNTKAYQGHGITVPHG